MIDFDAIESRRLRVLTALNNGTLDMESEDYKTLMETDMPTLLAEAANGRS